MVERAPVAETQKAWPKTLLTAEIRGFCAGVRRSVNMYDSFQEEYLSAKNEDPNIGRLVSVGEPAHNSDVIDRYREHVTFVDKIDDIEAGDWVLQGPHGSSERDFRIAKEKGVLYDATMCGLVERPSERVQENTMAGITTIYYGERGHEEARAVTEGQNAIIVETMEEALIVAAKLKEENPDKPFAFASQTTKNADDAHEIVEHLSNIYPDVLKPRKEDTCYATRNRQLSVKELINQGAKAVVIVGSPTSSNANRLLEIAGEKVPAFLVGNVDEFDISQLQGYETIAVHSSASTPESSFEILLNKFIAKGTQIETIRVKDKEGKIIDESKTVFRPGKVLDFRK